MKIKSFYADSMDRALQAASKELGEEALILNTRESPIEFRHFGKYEVVCACANPPQFETIVAPLTSTPVVQSASEPVSRRVVVLVGPSGAGKSSTCAKIAIRANLSGTASPALLTWDSGRVGGPDLLRAFADIASIPLREVDSADDFAIALNELRGHDLFVVDTPALDSEDPICDRLAAALEAARRSASIAGDVIEIHFVVSGAFSSEYLQKCFERYSIFNPTFLLPTHLDEAKLDLSASGLERLGVLQIEWCGTGRAVPEDLQESAQVLAREAAMLPAVASAPSAAVIPPASAITAIEQILTRFRREAIPPSTHMIRVAARNAA